MYNTIIYDVDGTLIDTEKAVLGSLQSMLKIDYGKVVPQQDLYFVLGIPGSKSLPQLGISDIDRANERWNYFMKDFFHSIEVFSGIKDVLDTLKNRNIIQGIVTSKTYEELLNDFVPFGLSSYLTHTVCADDTKKHKPHPEPLIKFLEISGADPKKSIYIGDTIYDYECAKDAGIDFGLALWGCKNYQNIHTKYKFKRPQDIISLLD
ncbi:HAD family hydrolase [Neobacillus niacini]|uniref:HAD family hydrolase n=1 Tax=Neobacillus niacini TaxID=86668 RepID=UPI0021CB25E6|nr:HAD family hydrolase [Neobacillus niacini]MCM3768334.1 HAD family hydrolase [Neobacillus niacini]